MSNYRLRSLMLLAAITTMYMTIDAVIIDTISNHSIYTVEVARIGDPVALGTKEIAGYQIYGKPGDDFSDDECFEKHYKITDIGLNLSNMNSIRVLIQKEKPCLYFLTFDRDSIRIIYKGREIKTIHLANAQETKLKLTICSKANLLLTKIK